jgi:DNA-binding transcriptional LysR family regulator
MLNLTQINHLVALAEECHFARAATRVHLSQPAFSRSIQAIERKSDLRLFERQPGSVRLTSAGEFFIQKARQLLFDARNLERDIALYRTADLGDIAFGMGPFPAATLLRETLSELRQCHPRVSIRTEINNWRQLHENLLREDIEFFVATIADIGNTAALDIRPLVRQKVDFYVRSEHPLANIETPFFTMWDYGVAATKLTTSLRQRLAKQLRLEQDAELTLAVQCDDIDLLHHLALTSDTVIISTDRAVHKKGHDALLRKLIIREIPTIDLQIGIVSLRNRTPSPMAIKVLQTLEHLCAN